MTDNNQEHRYEHLFDANVTDQNNDRIGKVEQVYLDDKTGLPTWVTVKTGIFGSKETFVPLDRAIISAEEIQVPYEKDFVEDAPNYDPDRHLDSAAETELYAYYGFSVPNQPIDDILPASQPWTISGESGDGVDPEDFGPTFAGPQRGLDEAAQEQPDVSPTKAHAWTAPVDRSRHGFVPSPVLSFGPYEVSEEARLEAERVKAELTDERVFLASPIPTEGPYGKNPEDELWAKFNQS